MHHHIRKARTTDGFTLIELLVVVVILVALAAIAIPIFLNQKARSAQAATIATVTNLAKAVTGGLGTGTLAASTVSGSGDSTQYSGTLTTLAGSQAVPDGALVYVNKASSVFCISYQGNADETYSYTSAAPTVEPGHGSCLSAVATGGAAGGGGGAISDPTLAALVAFGNTLTPQIVSGIAERHKTSLGGGFVGDLGYQSNVYSPTNVQMAFLRANTDYARTPLRLGNYVSVNWSFADSAPSNVDAGFGFYQDWPKAPDGSNVWAVASGASATSTDFCYTLATDAAAPPAGLPLGIRAVFTQAGYQADATTCNADGIVSTGPIPVHP